ncbi:hypothetical protein AVEN_159796-1 [Araneus ventricosus]|uniref:Uncharacterized protein n=1 Tax=Araneus ventricosus TaxID=182803 RepID=A0A4Y2KIW0_ARAVE|nr:hypothetical protein AVEN_159796-1 [Araneus ventricosus]
MRTLLAFTYCHLGDELLFPNLSDVLQVQQTISIFRELKLLKVMFVCFFFPPPGTDVLKHMEKLQNELKKLNDRYIEISNNLDTLRHLETVRNVKKEKIENTPISEIVGSPPPGIDMPVTSDEGLVELDAKLSDVQLSNALVRYFLAVGYGKRPRIFIANVLRKLLSQNVAQMYSRLGRKGKKSFQVYSRILRSVLAATSLKFPTMEKESLVELFGRALAGAGDWGPRRRPSSNRPQNP